MHGCVLLFSCHLLRTAEPPLSPGAGTAAVHSIALFSPHHLHLLIRRLPINYWKNNLVIFILNFSLKGLFLWHFPKDHNQNSFIVELLQHRCCSLLLMTPSILPLNFSSQKAPFSFFLLFSVHTLSSRVTFCRRVGLARELSGNKNSIIFCLRELLFHSVVRQQEQPQLWAPSCLYA